MKLPVLRRAETNPPDKIENKESEPVGKMREILAQAPPFENRCLGFYCAENGSHIYSTVCARDLLKHIPEADPWTIASWFLICHPLKNGNGRKIRTYLSDLGIDVPEKTFTTYEDDGWGQMIAVDRRAHIDPDFARAHRQQIFEWFNNHWHEYQEKKGKGITYRLEPGLLAEFKRRLEENPFVFPQADRV